MNAVYTAARMVNKHVLSRFGLQIAHPTVIHGPAASMGVVDWSQRLWGFEPFLTRLKDVSGDFVECGVYYGHGLLILLHLNRFEGAPRHIWGFDGFQGHSAPSAADLNSEKAIKLGKLYKVTEQDVWKTLSLGTGEQESELRSKVTLVSGWLSETLPKHSGQIAFLHLDPDYYQPTKDALTILWPRISPGGVVMFGMLENPSLPGKGIAVKEFAASRPSGLLGVYHDAASNYHYLLKSR